MSTVLQKWQEKLQAEGEEFYFAGELGRGELLGLSMHMLFISNTRLIFLKSSFFQIHMVSIFISQISALRLVKKTRRGLVAFGFGLCVAGIMLSFMHAQINNLLGLSTLLRQSDGFIILGFGVFCLILSKLWLQARIFLDINGLPAPLKLPWFWGDEVFMNLTKNITYYLTLNKES